MTAWTLKRVQEKFVDGIARSCAALWPGPARKLPRADVGTEDYGPKGIHCSPAGREAIPGPNGRRSQNSGSASFTLVGRPSLQRTQSGRGWPL